ncbi:M23 family metallopeptidase [Marinobacterium weihaiense]|uniref:Peptidoglycan DD-metalloendopeptidase family protein n=1 Tax=Marinobacterium weihaiense TaxID=2851016 RepID=A0ABS6M7J1_9GAMM|nr:M23 family metallopeptidase [Marinobacterium weihaiense]MBV0932232.1 peptidoglycan DD-metalloendopeptidase family protein [Marinobacterium weihaiense]
MRRKLVLTLTTRHGSRQVFLHQILAYLLLIFILLSGLSFFVSNWLLVKTHDDLTDLERNHRDLSEQYELLLGTQQLYLSELTELGISLNDLSAERERLVEENEEVGETLARLESRLGLTEQPSGMTLEQRLALTRTAARQRLFLLHSIPNGVPISAERINDSYGMRMHPVLNTRKMHNGMDFKADRGTPVYATADGVVEYAGYRKGSGFGNLVVLQHNFGLKTYYAHLQKVLVESGTFVHKGQKIALSGNSGRSTGAHLHYEVRFMYRPLNPEPFLQWGLDNFETLFTKIEEVPWESLSVMYPLNQGGTQ